MATSSILTNICFLVFLKRRSLKKKFLATLNYKNNHTISKLSQSPKFQPLKCRFFLWHFSPKKKSNINAAILNSTQQLATHLCSHSVQGILSMASDKPFNYMCTTLSYGCSWEVLFWTEHTPDSMIAVTITRLTTYNNLFIAIFSVSSHSVCGHLHSI